MESQLNQIVEAAERLIKKYDTKPSFMDGEELVKLGKAEGIQEILSMIREIQEAEVNRCQEK